MTTRKQEFRQQIMATIVVFFMGMMILGSMNVRNSEAVGNNVTLIQNFVQGTLQMEAASSLVFNNITIGVAADSLANLDIVNMRDYRGTGAGWSVTGVMNNLTTAAAGVNNISNASIWWTPGSQFALDSASNTGVTTGATGAFNEQRALITATSGNGLGNYRVNSTILNVVYGGSPTQLAGIYQNTLTLTIN